MRARSVAEMDRPAGLWTPGTLIGHLLLSGRGTLIIAVVLLAIAASVHMTVPWLLAQVIDQGLVAANRNELLRWSLVLLLVALINPAAYLLGYRYMALLEADGRRTVARLATRSAIAGDEREARSAGETVNVVTSDSEMVASVYSTVGHGAMNFVAFILGVSVVWAINPLLGGAIGLGVVATTLIVGPLLGRLEQHWSGYRDSLSTTTDHAADTIAGLRVLRGLGGEERFLERYRLRSRELLARSYQVAGHSSWVRALQEAVPVAYLATVTGVGARLAIDGTITVGELSAAFGYATALVMYSGSLLGNVHDVIGIRIAARRIADHLRDRTERAPRPPGCSGQTSVLEVRRGILTVLLTTDIAHVRQGLEVLGEPSLLVAEDDYLFAGPLHEVMNSTPDRTMEALDAACGGDVLESIGGSLDCTIENKGVNLSGGQRQRLVLARALARDPDVLLLCDPTSAVDAATELAVAEGVRQYRHGQTTVVATGSRIWAAAADAIVLAPRTPFLLALTSPATESTFDRVDA